MKTKIKLKIADIIIQMQSIFTPEHLSQEEEKRQIASRFNNFFYRGSQDPDILINVEIQDKSPQIHNTKPLFITRHFDSGDENWRILKKGQSIIYKCPLKDKKQVMVVNKKFDRVIAYLLPKKDKERAWNITDIIYDFLQVLLINYFALRKLGIFTHAIGVKDLDGKGLLFAGKSGAGKSTTARLWHKHSKVMVLNDDRIIVRKNNGNFFIYGSPWHGEFGDYLASRIDSAPIDKLFFIHHAPRNNVRRIRVKEAFNSLYPAIFPTFWDKGCLENIVSFCQDLVENIPCYSLGFVNDRRVIDFVRRINIKKEIG
ncbi:MAG: hypothetical protein V1674_02690 [Candidatus Omnitrophota bacterium]